MTFGGTDDLDDPAVYRYWEFVNAAKWNVPPSLQMLDREPLKKPETLGFPHPDSYKRSALLTDRVHLPYWAKDELSRQVPVEITFGHAKIDGETAESFHLGYELSSGIPLQYRGSGDSSRKFLYSSFVLESLKSYAALYPQSTVVPFNFDLDALFAPSGFDHAYEAVLAKVPIVIEEALTWEQVIDFRKDADSIRKYRDLHLWMRTALSAAVPQAVDDLVGQKLDDYTWAIRKHGLQTRLSMMTSLVAAAGAGVPAGGIVASLAHLDPALGAVSGAALCLLSGAAWITKRSIELLDAQRGTGREAAYLYDVNRLVE